MNPRKVSFKKVNGELDMEEIATLQSFAAAFKSFHNDPNSPYPPCRYCGEPIDEMGKLMGLDKCIACVDQNDEDEDFIPKKKEMCAKMLPQAIEEAKKAHHIWQAKKRFADKLRIAVKEKEEDERIERRIKMYDEYDKEEKEKPKVPDGVIEGKMAT